MKFERLEVLLEQIDDISGVRLTDTQKVVLVNIYAAPTPEMSYDISMGHENLMTARKQLRAMGLILVDDQNSRAAISDSGQVMLVNNNLIDDVGEMTEEGNSLLIKESQPKPDDIINEDFKLIKTLI